jgi:predicted acylesterase/phospholipase RssA
MAHVPEDGSTTENPPGCNFTRGFWENLKGSKLIEPIAFNKGERIVPSRRSAEEIYFIREGIVAADVASRGQTRRRLLLARGAKFKPTTKAESTRYSSLTDVKAYRLSRSAMVDDQWRTTIMESMGHLEVLHPCLLDAVKAFLAQPVLRYLSSKLVLDLVTREGIAIVLEPGSEPVSCSKRPGLYFVADGEARLLNADGQSPAAPATFWNCHRLTDGVVYSGQDNIAPQKNGCTLVCLPEDGIRRFFNSSPSFRRAVASGDKTCAPNWYTEGARNRRRLPQFVLLAATEVDAAIPTLTSLLAETVGADFGSKTLILTLKPKSARLSPPKSRYEPFRGIFESFIGINAFSFSEPTLADFDTVFLVVEKELSNKEICERFNSPAAWAAGSDDLAPSPTVAPPILVVLITGNPFADRPEDLKPLRDCREQRVVLLGGGLGDQDPAFLPGTIRLRLNLEELRHLDPPLLARVPSSVRASLSRLARAVTDRLVGVALGGGGAWAYAHISLLRAMVEEGIPVDLVSGASGGALVGAYYCALGMKGLDRLGSVGLRLDLGGLLSTVCSTRPLAWALDVDLERRRLRDLDVPLFTIVADLTNGVEFVPRRGGLSVAECVRASSGLVPMMAANTFENRRCVDGVFINNCGERVLAEEGADLLIASDVVQTPADAPPGGVLDFVYRLRRIRDTIDGSHLLVQSSDARDAFLADCTFEATRLPTSAVGFFRGSLNDAVARPQAEKFVEEQVKPLWENLRAP